MPKAASLIAAAAAAFLAGSAAAAPPAREKKPPERVAPTRVLTPFAGEGEFRRYLKQVRRAASQRDMWWAAREDAVRFTQAEANGDVESDALEALACDPAVEECAGDGSDSITVTGSRVQPKNPSITNNQKVGVEEGDIVKQVGNFLLVLQDGRLFSVDLGRGAGDLRVADRVNVYRNPIADTWYDEMLVTGDRVLITGYSYDEESTELSLFRVAPTGRLESLGTFYMSSNDYYDGDNYATRLIGDRLIVYTPLALSEMKPNRKFEWPIVRRWLPGEKRDEARERGRPVLDIRNVYKPVVETYEPVIHSVSVCPLGEADGRRDLECTATGFVGPGRAELYVSTTAAYLWTSPSSDDVEALREDRRCPASGFDFPGALYALPLRGDEEEEPGVIGVRGAPLDHFSLETNRGEFRALLHTPVKPCATPGDDDEDDDDEREKPLELSYFRVPLSEFGPELLAAGRRSYTKVPSPEGRYIANRFTDDYVVYGAIGRRSLWYLLGERDEDEERPAIDRATAYAVPVRRPEAARRLPLEHNVIRAERSGNDIVLTGYRDPAGLDISYIDLKGEPRVASNVRLLGRYESEGRSHAFNAAVDEAGAGLMGLPTVTRPEGGGRWWWNSIASDVSFLSVDGRGRLADSGPLLSNAPVGDGYDSEGVGENGVAGYTCEVSCIDWYGNSRPIFTGGRVFALTGTELVEGRLDRGRIREIGRLSIAGPTRPR